MTLHPALPVVGALSRLGALAVVMSACGPTPPPLPPLPDTIPEIAPENVESVIFIYGDAGEAYLSTSPTLARLQQDVDEWAARLPADSSVVVLNLGDIVYPEGVRPVDHPAYPSDTAVVMSQVRVVHGTSAVERGALQLFTSGNHDWGLEEHWEGYVRLLNLEALMESARANLGANVALVPEAGTGGPYVLDWGEYFRFLIIDASWWVLLADDAGKEQFIADVAEALEGAGNRSVLIAAHHPFKSAGSHGGEFPFWETLGLRYVLHRAGAVLQDLTSIPFRELEENLRRVFAEHERPLIFAGGHDHSIQVLAGSESTDPVFILVSGSASKLTSVGTREDVLFGQQAPGYMRIVVERDGDAHLFVEATAPEYLHCPTTEPQRQECMQAGIAAYRTVYWRQVR